MSEGCPSEDDWVAECDCSDSGGLDPLCAEYCLLESGVPDCEVGLLDLCGNGTYWSSELGICIPFATCPEDLNGDGQVSVSDLLVLLANFQIVCPD